MKSILFIIIFLSFALLAAGEGIIPQIPGEEEIVGIGCMGECNAQPIIIIEYVVDSQNDVQMIARRAESSLCPYDGVYVFMFKNTEEVSGGHLHNDNEVIQTIASPGDKIVLCAVRYPLTTGIQCIRWGELNFHLIKRNKAKGTKGCVQ